MNTITDSAGAQATPHPTISYREYLEGLLREPRHLFLLHAIKHFRWNGETQRNFWERYWNTRREAGDDLDTDQNYWERVWNMRQKAGRIIKGLESWPDEFTRWRKVQELHYYHGRGKRPAWLSSESQDESFADLHINLKPATLGRLKLNTRKVRK